MREAILYTMGIIRGQGSFPQGAGVANEGKVIVPVFRLAARRAEAGAFLQWDCGWFSQQPVQTACCIGHSQCTQSLLPRPQPVHTEPAAQATASANSLLPRPQPVQTEPVQQATASAHRACFAGHSQCKQALFALAVAWAAGSVSGRAGEAQSRQFVRCDNRQSIITMSHHSPYAPVTILYIITVSIGSLLYHSTIKN